MSHISTPMIPLGVSTVPHNKLGVWKFPVPYKYLSDHCPIKVPQWSPRCKYPSDPLGASTQWPSWSKYPSDPLGASTQWPSWSKYPSDPLGASTQWPSWCKYPLTPLGQVPQWPPLVQVPQWPPWCKYPVTLLVQVPSDPLGARLQVPQWPSWCKYPVTPLVHVPKWCISCTYPTNPSHTSAPHAWGVSYRTAGPLPPPLRPPEGRHTEWREYDRRPLWSPLWRVASTPSAAPILQSG